MNNRYANVPLSDKTKAGMTLTIDDLAAIGRLLTLQDDYYEEQFNKIFKGMNEINKILKDHEKRLRIVENKLIKHLEDHEKQIA